jgi:uncharacterized radical SAM superfamily Fe-S cluster-containing enzyme
MGKTPARIAVNIKGNETMATVQKEKFAKNVAQAAADAQSAATTLAQSFAKAKEEKQRPPQLNSKRLVSTEFVRKDYRAAVESGVSWETVLRHD